MNAFALLWLAGALVAFLSLCDRLEEREAAGLTAQPPARFWVLHIVLWFVDLVLYGYAGLSGDYTPSKRFDRFAWPTRGRR